MLENDRLPKDLITLREAERDTGVSIQTMRRWIYHTREMATYRKPGNGERVLVSRARVQRLQILKARGRGKGSDRPGRSTISLDVALTNQLRRAAKKISDRLGLAGRISRTEAIRLLVLKELGEEGLC